MTVDPRRAEELFHAALAIPTSEDRAAWLAEACAGDSALRQRVEGLLAAHFHAGSFLTSPPGDQGLPSNAALPGDEGPPHKGLPAAEVAHPGAEPGPGPHVAVPTSEDAPGARIGPYTLLEKLGEGGMGVVYLAEQHEPVRRRVALKIIKPGMDTTVVIARFQAERHALALMDHQNIAKVLEAGSTAAGRPYFVMELVQGVPITRFCDERHLTPRERLELFIPVCQAIQHAHQKGIIHRDIKPSNVLVTFYDGRPIPKVIDFGVAKAIESACRGLTGWTLGFQLGTLAGTVVGTWEYMSPEQAEMRPGMTGTVDTRSDIYSLGVFAVRAPDGLHPLGARPPARGGLHRDAADDSRARPPQAQLAALGLGWLAPFHRGAAQDRARPAFQASPGGFGLDRHEGPGEGPHATLRNGQRAGAGCGTLPGGRTGRSLPPVPRL